MGVFGLIWARAVGDNWIGKVSLGLFALGWIMLLVVEPRILVGLGLAANWLRVDEPRAHIASPCQPQLEQSANDTKTVPVVVVSGIAS